MPLKQILASQDRWAQKNWPGHRGPRAPSLDSNLMTAMSPAVRTDYAAGSGVELGTQGRPGKMCSLRSSSALTCSFFAPWIGSDLSALAAALQSHVADRTLRFERQFRHGLSSTAPNLDVALDNDQARPLGIECKFTEPYGTKKSRPALDSKYFAGGRVRWAELGLPKCQELANALGRSSQFKRLDVGQLLKHFLGLAWSTKQPPRLVYLWFDTKCVEAAEHLAELDRFVAAIDDSVSFAPVTYQAAFAQLRDRVEPTTGYFKYLEARYFAA